MPRNFVRRIEIAFPVVEPQLQKRLKEILEFQLTDTVKSWWMKADGSYVRNPRGEPAARFQERIYEILQAEGRPGTSKNIAAIDEQDFRAVDY